MEASCRHFHIFCHRAIHSITKSLPRGIKIIQPDFRHRIVQINYCRRFTHNAVALFPGCNILSCFSNNSPEFMSQHNGIIYRPAMVRRPLMQITAANANICNFKQHIIRSWFRSLNFPDLYRPLIT